MKEDLEKIQKARDGIKSVLFTDEEFQASAGKKRFFGGTFQMLKAFESLKGTEEQQGRTTKPPVLVATSCW